MTVLRRSRRLARAGGAALLIRSHVAAGWGYNAEGQLRDGTITNIQTERSSNNYSVDASAIRAIQASSPVNPLPGEYSGNRVGVEFWFDFHRP